MNINITTDNIELSDKTKEYINKRLENIGRLMDTAPDAVMQVIVGRTTNHHRHGDIYKADINFTSGRDFFVKAEASDVTQAFDKAQADLERMLTQYKDKKQALWKKGALKMKNMAKGIIDYPRKWWRK